MPEKRCEVFKFLEIITIEMSYFPRTRNVSGTPEMKATSFLFEDTRTPICQSLR